MSPSRRDILKLATGLGLAAAVPTSAERIAAMKALNVPVSETVLLDPGSFAQELYGTLANEHDWFEGMDPEQHAKYVKAEHAFVTAIPWLKDHRPTKLLYNDYSNETFMFIMSAYYAGLRHGAAFENLRRSVVGDTALCHGCWGLGITNAGETCSCGGTGTVAIVATATGTAQPAKGVRS